ncbi:MAG: hypothetical protein Q9M50_11195 [Methylococcales bacterium]|nr:hypothetical protein [Methylococcales bacterium]
MKNKLLITSILLLFNVLSGCSTHTNEVFDLYQTVLPPVRNITRFEKSLECFRELLRKDYKGEVITITSNGIPNHAGRDLSLLSGRDMLISTISQLRSKKIKFIVVPSAPTINQFSDNMAIAGGDPLLFDKYIDLYQKWFPSGLLKQPHYPDYRIIGSISQLDKGVISGNASASLAFEDSNIGFSRDDMTSIITMDMNIEDTADFSILNGVGSSNSIAVYRAGIAGDLGGRLKRAGVFFDFSFDRSEGVHQAIRTLIQLGTIEMLGKLANVPYESCLKLSQSTT